MPANGRQASVKANNLGDKNFGSTEVDCFHSRCIARHAGVFEESVTLRVVPAFSASARHRYDRPARHDNKGCLHPAAQNGRPGQPHCRATRATLFPTDQDRHQDRRFDDGLGVRCDNTHGVWHSRHFWAPWWCGSAVDRLLPSAAAALATFHACARGPGWGA